MTDGSYLTCPSLSNFSYEMRIITEPLLGFPTEGLFIHPLHLSSLNASSRNTSGLPGQAEVLYGIHTPFLCPTSLIQHFIFL